MDVTSDQLAQLREFARRWQVSRLWLFGSVAAGTATPSSDVDVLVEFAADAATSTWDWPAMQDELGVIFARRVDLLSTGVLENPWRRRTIEQTRKLIYAA
ncbi:MAG: nucleotidyltransferase domain-containing protein [Phycisphaerales bacterium]|nr:nucleotidyltransferase domain-containing protein [Phycisphaerales bacterium]